MSSYLILKNEHKAMHKKTVSFITFEAGLGIIFYCLFA